MRDIIVSKDTRNQAVAHMIVGRLDITFNYHGSQCREKKPMCLFSLLLEAFETRPHNLLTFICLEFFCFLYFQSMFCAKQASHSEKDYREIMDEFHKLFFEGSISIFGEDAKYEIEEHLSLRVSSYSSILNGSCESERDVKVIDHFFSCLEEDSQRKLALMKTGLIREQLEELVANYHSQLKVVISAIDQFLVDKSKTRFVVPYRGNLVIKKEELQVPSYSDVLEPQEGGYLPIDTWLSTVADMFSSRKKPDVTELPPGLFNRTIRSISETSLSAPSWHLFSAGQNLAVLHGFKLLHGDLHKSNIRFDPFTGHIIMLDNQTMSYSDLTPASSYRDLMPAFMTLNEAEFNSFIAGYINISDTYLEQLYGNFTRELLDICGLRISFRSTPRPSTIFINKILQGLGFNLKMGEVLFLEAREDQRPDPHFIISNEDQITVVICGLVVSGVNCFPIHKALLSVMNKLNQNNNCVTLLELLYVQQNESRKPYLMSPVQEIAHALFIALAESRVIFSNNNMQPNFLSLKVFEKYLRLFQTKEGKYFLCAVIDVVSHLTKAVLDLGTKEIGTRLSINLAQFLTYLHGLLLNDKCDEDGLLTFLQQSYALPWIKTFLAPPSDTNVIHNELAYANARATLLLSIFQASLQNAENSNLRWSFIWRGLQLSKQIVFAIDRLIGKESNPLNLENLKITARPLISNYFKALKLYSDGLFSGRHSNLVIEPWTDLKDVARFKAGPILELIESSHSIIDILENEPITSQNARKSLTDVISKMQPSTLLSPVGMMLR